RRPLFESARVRRRAPEPASDAARSPAGRTTPRRVVRAAGARNGAADREPARGNPMTVTFTPAAERDTRRQRERARRFGIGDLLLVATSCFVALAIALAYVGRFAA